MTSLTIPDIPDEIVAGLDAHAEELGLSRNEFIRRMFRQEAQRSTGHMTSDDIRRFGERFKDLPDPKAIAAFRE